MKQEGGKVKKEQWRRGKNKRMGFKRKGLRQGWRRGRWRAKWAKSGELWEVEVVDRDWARKREREK